MKYELINPSDAIVLEADDLRDAACAALIVGAGAYGLSDESGDIVMPIMLFRLDAAWIQSHFDEGDSRGTPEDVVVRWLRDHSQGVATCLRSFRCTGKRTSLNDICERAAQYAKLVEESEI